MNYILILLVIRNTLTYISSSYRYSEYLIQNYSRSISYTENATFYAQISNIYSYTLFTASNSNNVVIFKLVDGQYELVSQFTFQCNVGSTATGMPIFSYDGSVLLIRGTTSTYRHSVYSFDGNSTKLIGCMAYMHENNQDIYIKSNSTILVFTTSTTDIYKYDIVSKSFVFSTSLPFSGGTAPSANLMRVNISPDSKYIFQFNSNKNFNVYKLLAGSYVLYLTTVVVATSPSITLGAMDIESVNNTYRVIVTFQDGVNHVAQYYKLIPSTNYLNYANTIVTAVSPFTYRNVDLSRNMQYLVIPSNCLVYLYEYDGMIDNYVQTQAISTPQTDYTSNTSLCTIKPVISQDGKKISLSLTTNSQPYIMGVIYFDCNVNLCENCFLNNTCEICQSGYYLQEDGSCGCDVDYALSGTVCVLCQIQYCDACVSVNVCVSCQPNFILEGNECVCPAEYSINSKGQCTSCNINNCYICEQPDFCSVFSTDEQLEYKVNAVMGIVIVLLIVVVIMGVAMVLMAKKMAISSKSVTDIVIPENEKKIQMNTSLSSAKIDQFSNSVSQIKQEEATTKINKRRKPKLKQSQLQICQVQID